MWTCPPVSFQTSQQSIVPKRRSPFQLFPGALYVVQNPFDFRAREISVDDQARLVTKFIDQAAGLEVFANRGGLTGLPDDGVVHGVARVLIPDDGRFTLVGDADGRDFTGCHIGLCQGFAHDFDHAVENFIGIVFDPARFREILREFLLADADDMRFIIEIIARLLVVPASKAITYCFSCIIKLLLSSMTLIFSFATCIEDFP